MPGIVAPEKIRAHLGISVADFVPLEHRRSDAFCPAAKDALTDPDKLRFHNQILHREWQARCAAINETFGTIPEKAGHEKKLAVAKEKLAKYSPAEIEMLPWMSRLTMLTT